LAYGTRNVVNPNTGDTIIPANSNLVFRVALADIQ
jgi:FKBP-type peptidyl-prolyl cis-trans isomerase